MISKTRRNRRNRITKSKRISGGKKGDEHTWNLGVCLIKKKEGSSKFWKDNDLYWIEYPTDPLPEGWIQQKYYYETILPVYIYVGTVVNNKQFIYYQVYTPQAFLNLYEGSKLTSWRPLSEAGDKTMTKTEYIKKLKENDWKKTQVVPNSTTTGLKNFVSSMFFFKEIKKIGTNSLFPQYTEIVELWKVRRYGKFLYNIIISYDHTDVPDEFKKLHKMMRSWNFSVNPIFDYFSFNYEPTKRH